MNSASCSKHCPTCCWLSSSPFPCSWLLRTLAKRFYARLGRRAERAGFFRTVSLFLVSNVTDLLIVLLAWTLGYLVTILAVGEFGSIGIRQSMYLNAFLLVEIGKVVVRAVLSPAASGLRLVNVTDHAAIAINRSLSLVISVLGYGQLLVVPIVNRSASMAAGSGVSALSVGLRAALSGLRGNSPP